MEKKIKVSLWSLCVFIKLMKFDFKIYKVINILKNSYLVFLEMVYKGF